MSTRATVHFGSQNADGKFTKQAIVYRHHDGYPAGLGKDLKTFLEEVKKTCPDTRFYDPCYLAAKFVVWQADQYANKDNKLDFLSLGVCLEDPSDIEYRYLVICDFKCDMPKVRMRHV